MMCCATGVEEGLQNMTKGEQAVFSCPAEYARGSSLLPDPPGHSDRVEFDLHLLSLTQVGHVHMHNASDVSLHSHA